METMNSDLCLRYRILSRILDEDELAESRVARRLWREPPELRWPLVLVAADYPPAGPAAHRPTRA
jgi:hypothetical protein